MSEADVPEFINEFIVYSTAIPGTSQLATESGPTVPWPGHPSADSSQLVPRIETVQLALRSLQLRPGTVQLAPRSLQIGPGTVASSTKYLADARVGLSASSRDCTTNSTRCTTLPSGLLD